MVTVLPSEARAKIDFRLVADQDPESIFESLSHHAEDQVPPGIDVTLTRVATMAPQRTSADSWVVEPMMRAVNKGWRKEPILKPSLGGSVPTYVFAETLNIPCLVVPMRMPTRTTTHQTRTLRSLVSVLEPGPPSNCSRSSPTRPRVSSLAELRCSID